jgi:sialic acid synthase SpsE/glycosyltransferase involved in cell wall biosynthesis
MEAKKISVVSIWYNQAHYLENFINALSDQTFKDFEVIFVDDGSSDNIEKMINSYCKDVFFDWVYIKRPDKGFTLNTSRNYGLSASRAEKVLFLDGDMLPSNKMIERHYNNLARGANCSVGGRIRTSHLGVSSDERYHIFIQQNWKEKPYLYAFGCNLAIDKVFLSKNNISFDESYNGKYGLDDIDFAYRCYKAGAIFIYDLHASATHLPDDYPNISKLSQSMQNFEKFKKYHFVTGIIQSGPVFFEHKYNADLYRKIIGGEEMINQEIKIKIGHQGKQKLTREIGYGQPTFIIAEAGLSHNGSFELAKKMVELAAVSGADCVKFQKRDVDQMATKYVYKNTPTPIPELGETYREVREKHELTLEQFEELKQLSEGLGLFFMITPFDLQSVEFCEKLKVVCYKIASHSLTDIPTVKKIASLKKPIFLSTGMSTPEEIDIAVKTIREHHNQFVLMHCVSSYPHRDEDTNLNMIDYLRDRYKCLVGYSGHEDGTVITVAAVLKNAAAVERHFTLDKKMPGFDHSLSLSPQELFTLCQDIRRAEKALGIPEKRVLVSEMVARNAYRRSLVTVKSLKKGHILSESDFTVKEPGTGIPPYKIEQVVGRKLLVDLDGDVTLEWSHLAK